MLWSLRSHLGIVFKTDVRHILSVQLTQINSSIFLYITSHRRQTWYSQRLHQPVNFCKQTKAWTGPRELKMSPVAHAGWINIKLAQNLLRCTQNNPRFGWLPLWASKHLSSPNWTQPSTSLSLIPLKHTSKPLSNDTASTSEESCQVPRIKKGWPGKRQRKWGTRRRTLQLGLVGDFLASLFETLWHFYCLLSQW